jgi:hypothetical protein
MKWLTLSEIKQQLRIEPDFTDDDALLTRYGNSAEATVLNITGRTYDDFICDYGEIPADIWEATVLLVTLSYENRSPVSMQNMYAIPYAFDAKVKPYMKLTSSCESHDDFTPTILGSDIKIVFTANLPDGLKLADVDFVATVYNNSQKDAELLFKKDECHAIGDGEKYLLMFNSEQLGIGKYLMKLEVHVPDNDYLSGYSKEIVNIDPQIYVKG